MKHVTVSGAAAVILKVRTAGKKMSGPWASVHPGDRSSRSSAVALLVNAALQVPRLLSLQC